MGLSPRLTAAAVRRRRIRRALRESEARYRNLVEGASQPILILRRDGRFLFANRFACESVGLTPVWIRGDRVFGQGAAAPDAGAADHVVASLAEALRVCDGL